MSDITLCPYCNAKLRIASAPRGTRLRVKCRVCKNRFHPSQILEHGETRLNSPLIQNSVPTDIESSPPELDGVEAPKPAFQPPLVVPEPRTAAEPRGLALDPFVQQSAYPAELIERRSERRHDRRSEDSEGESTRVRKSRHGGSDRKHIKAALVIMLLLSGTTIAAVAVWSYVKGIATAQTAPTRTSQTDGPDATTGDLVKSIPVLARDQNSPGAARVVGIWEIRTDDETHGWFDFRTDGSLRQYAWRNDKAFRPDATNWFVTTEEGESIVLEIGEERGGYGNNRWYLTMTSPDAFTLTRVYENGIQRNEANRFVRRGAARP